MAKFTPGVGKSSSKEISLPDHAQHKILDHVSAGICIIDAGGKVAKVNSAFCDICGYSRQELLGEHFNIILPEGVKKYAGSLHQDLIQGIAEESGGEWQVVDRQGCMKEVCADIRILTTDTGEKFTVVTVTDPVERKGEVERLQKALQEKDNFVKEVHHEVKNNFNVISGLLFLQAEKVKDNPELYELFKESMNRLKTVAMIHEQLNSQSNFFSISLKTYVSSLSRNLQSSYVQTAQNITVDLNIDDVAIAVDKAIACGLIIYEAVSNSLKHAFEAEQPGKIWLSILNVGRQLKIVIRDNGKGLPPDFELQKTHTLGMDIIKVFSGQLNGELLVEGNNGTEVRLLFDI